MYIFVQIYEYSEYDLSQNTLRQNRMCSIQAIPNSRYRIMNYSSHESEVQPVPRISDITYLFYCRYFAISRGSLLCNAERRNGPSLFVIIVELPPIKQNNTDVLLFPLLYIHGSACLNADAFRYLRRTRKCREAKVERRHGGYSGRADARMDFQRAAQRVSCFLNPVKLPGWGSLYNL